MTQGEYPGVKGYPLRWRKNAEETEGHTYEGRGSRIAETKISIETKASEQEKRPRREKESQMHENHDKVHSLTLYGVCHRLNAQEGQVARRPLHPNLDTTTEGIDKKGKTETRIMGGEAIRRQNQAIAKAPMGEEI